MNVHIHKKCGSQVVAYPGIDFAMKTAKLTKRVAETALPKAERYVVWDGELAGFGLRIAPSGVRSWVAKYRSEGGGRSAPLRWLTFGTYPTVSANDAREAAEKALAAVRLGKDPAAERAHKRKEMRIADLIDLYEEEGLVVQRGVRQGQPMKPLTAQYTLARLRAHVVPLLGSRRASEIDEGDVERFARDVARGKTAKDEKIAPRKRIIVRGGEGAARKVVRDLSAVFSFAMRRRIVSAKCSEQLGQRGDATRKIDSSVRHETKRKPRWGKTIVSYSDRTLRTKDRSWW